MITIANESYLMDRSSNHSQNISEKSFENKCALSLYHGIPIVTINGFLSLFGTFGNFLVIFAVLKTPRLRLKISSFLLLSLAVSDLLVTMCAQPLQAISVSFKTITHHCVTGVDFAYDITGNLSVFCSLFHLSAMSIDRAFVVKKPHRHDILMRKYGLKAMLFICWGIAVIFVGIRVSFRSTMMLSIVLIALNYVIIIISYAVIFCHIFKKKVRSEDRAAGETSGLQNYNTEKRVARAIAIVVVFFSLCWFPLFGYYIYAREGFIRDIKSVTYMWVRTLVLSNSSMNFLVYSWQIKHFRVAYLAIIRNIIGRPRQGLEAAKKKPEISLPNTNCTVQTTETRLDDDNQVNSVLSLKEPAVNIQEHIKTTANDCLCSEISTPK